MSFLGRILRGRKNGPSGSKNFREVLDRAVADLQAKTLGHDSTWRLSEADWSVNQDDGIIVFTTPNGICAKAAVQIIGTYNTDDGTWLWGWDNPSLASPLVDHAAKLRAYGEEHSIARLTTSKFECSEEECWELAALASMLCSAQGAYRGPSGTTMVFMTFGDVSLSKADI